MGGGIAQQFHRAPHSSATWAVQILNPVPANDAADASSAATEMRALQVHAAASSTIEAPSS